MKSFIYVLSVFISFSSFAFLSGEEILSQYEFKKIEMNLEKERSSYDISFGEMFLREKQSDELIQYRFKLYQAKSSRKRLLILNPNIDGVTILERRLAHSLAKYGYHVLIPFARMESFPFDENTTETINLTQKRAMVGTLSLIEQLNEKLDFHADKLGLLGASQGGIRSSMLFGLDFRFKALFSAVAGGDFPSLFANTQIDPLVEYRKKHKEVLGIQSNQTYEDHLRSVLRFDPLMITQSPHLSGVAMVIANQDDIVPTANQWKLWKAIKAKGIHPKTWVKDLGHIPGALQLIVYEKSLKDWFDKHLE